jgi:hypothetical protein
MDRLHAVPKICQQCCQVVQHANAAFLYACIRTNQLKKRRLRTHTYWLHSSLVKLQIVFKPSHTSILTSNTRLYSHAAPVVLVLQRHAQHVGSDGEPSQLPQQS